MAELPDSLLFDSSARYNDLGLIKERAFGEMQVMRPSLHVQYAVRNQPITTDPSLWVQHAVRSSQLESQIRSASALAYNSATPGFNTLIDPFALGAPKPEGSVKVAEIPAAEQRGEAVARPAVDQQVPVEVVKTTEPVEKAQKQPQAAAGLRSQLERFAKDRNQSARPITRATVRS
jgi:hypothetical protein